MKDPFPTKLDEPRDYLRGLENPARPRCRNVLVFLRCDRVSLQQMHFNNRSHHRHVLILALDTAGTVIVDGVELPLAEKRALLVLPFQFHHYINLGSETLRWLFITFELDEGEALLGNLSHQVLAPDEQTLALWAQVAELWQGKAARDDLLPVLDQLLLRLSRNQPPAASGLRPARGSWIARTEALIREAIDERWTLEVVARQVGLSERQLRTRFEAETGVSIREYRANFQLHRAIVLMRDAKLSLGQVAELVGFNSSASFCRFMRRLTGQTPHEFRQKLK